MTETIFTKDAFDLYFDILTFTPNTEEAATRGRWRWFGFALEELPSRPSLYIHGLCSRLISPNGTRKTTTSNFVMSTRKPSLPSSVTRPISSSVSFCSQEGFFTGRPLTAVDYTSSQSTVKTPDWWLNGAMIPSLHSTQGRNGASPFAPSLAVSLWR